MLHEYKFKLYLTLAISFILLFFSLFISSKSIHATSGMIMNVEKKQLVLLGITSKLSHSAEKNQAEIFKAILLNDKESIQSVLNSFYEINNAVNELDTFVKYNAIEIDHINEVLTLIKKRIIGYQLVQNSLIDALKKGDKEDTNDAIIGFNATNAQLTHDIGTLVELVNHDLNTHINKMKNSNDESKKDIIYSFLLAIILITFSVYKLTFLHNQAKRDLIRAENAEEEQKKLQLQLLKYNDELEDQIAHKTRELHQKIYTHFLTGLPNRNQLLEDTHLYDFKQIAILNIDKFQKFNDVYGEEMGNVALVLCARFLQEKLEDENILLYHLGGDEFVIVVKNSSELYDAHFVKKIDSILKDFAHETFVYDDKKFTFNISAGLAFGGKEKMLAYADMALKDAKKRNKKLSIFSDNKELERLHQEDIECQKSLMAALENNQILSYFQPIIPIQDPTKPVKYESLVRMQKEDGKIVPPFNFINVAKANRVYDKLTARVVDNTLSTIERYQIPCSLNLSMVDIEDDNTLSMLYKRFAKFEYQELLTIELLETEEFKEYAKVYDFCLKVRSYGIKIALDDFGAGYSNFSHILNLPVDFIKIDSSLISNIDRDQNSKIMVETIVGLAKKLHVETIAEYVSSKDILETIRDLNVDYAQGFYTGKPEPIETHIHNRLA
ncbi:MAG: bifunctional diguanylate cyclase/phosphodiesterase [Sulfuricurvum sp.]|nr:bifunctional diguanylate cyclase/phosphodiesterase [Sulfuricurvum sp.]